MSTEDEVEIPRENKAFPNSPNPSGSTEGSSHDELLAGLAENAHDALLFRLEPGLRFVVQRWPDLPEGDQRAILAIVRKASNCAAKTQLE